MTSRSKGPAPPVRHCPLCGIAMQAGKTRDDQKHYDMFQCLTCDTSIVVTEQPRPK